MQCYGWADTACWLICKSLHVWDLHKAHRPSMLTFIFISHCKITSLYDLSKIASFPFWILSPFQCLLFPRLENCRLGYWSAFRWSSQMPFLPRSTSQLKFVQRLQNTLLLSETMKRQLRFIERPWSIVKQIVRSVLRKTVRPFYPGCRLICLDAEAS